MQQGGREGEGPVHPENLDHAASPLPSRPSVGILGIEKRILRALKDPSLPTLPGSLGVVDWPYAGLPYAHGHALESHSLIEHHIL